MYHKHIKSGHPLAVGDHLYKRGEVSLLPSGTQTGLRYTDSLGTRCDLPNTFTLASHYLLLVVLAEPVEVFGWLVGALVRLVLARTAP